MKNVKQNYFGLLLTSWSTLYSTSQSQTVAIYREHTSATPGTTLEHNFQSATATVENTWNQTVIISQENTPEGISLYTSRSDEAHSQRCHYRVVPCVWDEFRMFDVRLHNSKRCPPLRSRPEVAFWNLDAVSASVQDSENFIKKQRRRLCIDILNILKLRGRISIDQQYLAMIEMWIILLIAHP